MCKVGIIIPTRGERPKFTQHLAYMLGQQTVQPNYVAYMDYIPESEEKDITQRYRRGYDKLRSRGLDCILLLEDDDFYAPNYIEIQIKAWQEYGCPDLFGTNYTHYYHLRERAYFTMYHDTRSSAMSTLIKPELNFSWPPDHEPYTDSHLWMSTNLKGITYQPSKVICLGIKHGVGLTGGSFHTDRLQIFHGDRATPDKDGDWLRSIVDPVSFEFYRSYFDVNPH